MANNIKFQDTEKDRSRNWAFEVYPDSADPDWMKYLAESMIHAYVSPLHDKDLDPTGVPKKGHYHILLMYETVQYPHQVIDDVRMMVGKGLGGCNIIDNYDDSEFTYIRPIDKRRLEFIGLDQNGKSFGAVVKIRSKSGMARYLVHMDNADKYKYDPADVIVYGKPDYLEVCGSNYDRYECLNEMRLFCKENEIYTYEKLYDYAAENRSEDWFKVLSDSGTYVMDRYIKSMNYRIKEEKRKLLETPAGQFAEHMKNSSV